MGQISLHPPNRNITQLKNLILAGEFSVKVEIEEGARRTLLTLKRPMGDINAEEGGEIHYWSPLTSPFGLVTTSCGNPLLPLNHTLPHLNFTQLNITQLNSS